MRLIWSAQSQRELLEIAEYYDRFDPDLASAMIRRIETAPLPVLDFPRLGEVIDRQGARKWRVPNTPFLLLYDALPDGIAILSVNHDRSVWSRS